jgi:hypothetical protein
MAYNPAGEIVYETYESAHLWPCANQLSLKTFMALYRNVNESALTTDKLRSIRCYLYGALKINCFKRYLNRRNLSSIQKIYTEHSILVKVLRTNLLY